MQLVDFWRSRRRGLGRFKKPYARRRSGPTIGERCCSWVRRHTSRRHKSARPRTLWPQLFTSRGPLDSVITAMEPVCVHRSCFNAAVCWCWFGSVPLFRTVTSTPSDRLRSSGNFHLAARGRLAYIGGLPTQEQTSGVKCPSRAAPQRGPPQYLYDLDCNRESFGRSHLQAIAPTSNLDCRERRRSKIHVTQPGARVSFQFQVMSLASSVGGGLGSTLRERGKHQLSERAEHNLSGALRGWVRSCVPSRVGSAIGVEGCRPIGGTLHDASSAVRTAGPTPRVLRIEPAPRLNSSGGQGGWMQPAKST